MCNHSCKQASRIHTQECSNSECCTTPVCICMYVRKRFRLHLLILAPSCNVSLAPVCYLSLKILLFKIVIYQKFHCSSMIFVPLKKPSGKKVFFYKVNMLTAAADRLIANPKAGLKSHFIGLQTLQIWGGSREIFLCYFEIKFKFSHRIGSTRAISLERDKSLEHDGAANVFGPLKSKFLKFFFETQNIVH